MLAVGPMPKAWARPSGGEVDVGRSSRQDWGGPTIMLHAPYCVMCRQNHRKPGWALAVLVAWSIDRLAGWLTYKVYN